MKLENVSLSLLYIQRYFPLLHLAPSFCFQSMEFPETNNKLITTLSFLLCMLSLTYASKNCDFPAIFNFGDSNSDTGGLAAAFSPPNSPFGETFFHMPAGRYSDGRLIIDFIGAMFAESVPERDYFEKALYTFDIGQNDLGAGFSGNLSVEEVNATVPDIVNSFSANVKKIYNLGARSFWIHNTGPLGCLAYIFESFPLAEKDSAGCAKAYNEVAQHFNLNLKESVAQLRKDLPLAVFTYVDIYSVKYSLFSEPEKHGFELPLVVCCGYGGKYNFSSNVRCGDTVAANGTQIVVGSCDRPSVRVNWDGVHYTEAANKFIFDQISTGAFSDPPIPLKMACHNTTH
ncbi:esterase-like isoform X2 [Hevea brasiliensis]|uniref:esterase-like isoform X2 n=1 Tax=Hevea brasiliensis TaxID=3981 RepID=UPI0025F72A95|nr:esterase-like isoform X2 [Hevea brasiliensis]